MRLDFYTRRPHREQADLDLGGSGDALALHGRLQDVAFLDGGALPCEPAEIRRRAGVSAALWRSWPGRVEKKWPLAADGSGRVNAELLEELVRVQRLLASRSEGGKKGNKQRWKKTEQSEGESLSDRSAITQPRSAITQPRDRKGLGLGLEGNGKDERARASRRASPVPFIPPSVSEVSAYAIEKGLTLDADVFMDFYTSKGWKVGRTTMTDWKASVRNAARDGWTMKAKKAPAPAAGSHGYGDVLQGAPGSQERADAMEKGRRP
jgi:hypothetical protein